MIAARLSFADAIKKGIADYNRQGVEMRMSTPDEVSEQCEAFDAKHKVNKRAPKTARKRPRGVGYSDGQRNRIMDKVHSHMAEGYTTKESCEFAGISYRVYMAWRKRFNITEPKCNGKTGPKKGAKS